MKKLLLLGFAICLIAYPSFAQNQKPQIIVKKIDVDLRAAPKYTVSATGLQVPNDSSKKWLIIEAELESDPEWADEVQVKFFVVANYGPGAKDVPQSGYDVLATTVSIINMQRNANGGKKNIVPVFIDSNTVKRYGEGNLQKFIPEVAVQIMYKGVLQDLKWWKNEQKSGRFWETQQPKTGVLLNITQSPWNPGFTEIYEQVKPITPPPAF